MRAILCSLFDFLWVAVYVVFDSVVSLLLGVAVELLTGITGRCSHSNVLRSGFVLLLEELKAPLWIPVSVDFLVLV